VSFETAGIKLEAGAELPTQFGVFKIKEVSWDDIIVDINHALSGKTLTFEVEIIDIK
jgi:FKBP-type peptidyl-prolyl cis-trans isomerase 2